MHDTRHNLIGELTDRLGHEPLVVLEGLRSVLSESTAPVRRLDPALWGPAPDVDDVRAAAAGNIIRLARDRLVVTADALSRESVAELVGISPQAVSNRIHHNRLVAIREGRRWLMPAWQFDPGSAEPVLPGIADLLQAWPGSRMALSRWATTPNHDLAGRTPAAALRDDNVGDVVAAAAAIGA